MKSPVNLAQEPPFRLGPLEIFPATLEIIRDGEKVVVEPRVMQVLTALAHASGSVVARDELLQRCWEGRVVGDDAIHRILSRLRRLSEGVAKGVFKVETITKVGYRLVELSARKGAGPSARHDDLPTRLSRRGIVAEWDRRNTLGVIGVASLIALGGIYSTLFRDEIPSEAEALLQRARESLREGTLDQTTSAVALLRRAIEIVPERAEPWGALSLAYQEQAVRSNSGTRVQIEARCIAAARRALALDSQNADALTAIATLHPFYRRWLAYDADCKRALAVHPNHATLNRNYGHFLYHVGRSREAVSHFNRALAIDPLSPQLQWQRIMALWSAGQLEGADAAMERAITLWPRHYAVWFVTVRLLSYSGRAKAALAMIEDRDSRPTGIPDWNFDLSAKEARALDTNSPEDVDDAVAAYLSAARRGAGFAENAIVFASAAGRPDAAFELASGYFFNRGFKVGEQRFATEQGMYIARQQRYTAFLFVPPVSGLRADPRFEGLVGEIGLSNYWRTAALAPDYRRA